DVCGRSERSRVSDVFPRVEKTDTSNLFYMIFQVPGALFPPFKNAVKQILSERAELFTDVMLYSLHGSAELLLEFRAKENHVKELRAQLLALRTKLGSNKIQITRINVKHERDSE